MINSLLKLTAEELVDEVLGFSDQESMRALNDTIAHNYRIYDDIVLVRAEGPWLYTNEGEKFLDGVSAYSAVNLGHNNLFVRDVITYYLNKNTPTVLGRFLASKPLAYAGRLLKELTGYDSFLPTNGGVEAPEAAIKLARKYHHKRGLDNPEIIYFSQCFHGRTITCTQFSEDDVAFQGFGPFPEGFIKVQYNNIEALKSVLGPNTAAVLIEPVQGEGGINIPSPVYIKAVRKLCDDTDTLLIYDEVQTGWGRTGKLFAWEHTGTRPDILCTGKSLSAGFMPVSGIFAEKKIMDSFVPGSHGSTFGGSPLSMMTAIASVAEILRQKLPERAVELGSYVFPKLKELEKKSPIIKDVRGLGLMIGIELERGNKNANDYCVELVKEGLLVKDAHDWVVRFMPPIICTKDDLDFAVKCLEKVFI